VRGGPYGRMLAGCSIAPLADIPDGECREGGPEHVIRREEGVVAMPVLPRWRHEIGEPVEELKRREFDDGSDPRPRGLAAAARPDPAGRPVSGHHVAEAGEWPAREPQSYSRARSPVLASPDQRLSV
jgi:hypothetical protein